MIDITLNIQEILLFKLPLTYRHQTRSNTFCGEKATNFYLKVFDCKQWICWSEAFYAILSYVSMSFPVLCANIEEKY